jgi:hypothetical protein
MATVTDIIGRVRNELGDPVQPFRTSALCDGLTSWFDLPKQQINPGSETVEVISGATTTTLATPADYTMDYQLGQLQLTAAPANNAILVVTGNAWAMFSDNDLTVYVKDAVNEHCFNREVSERRRDAHGFSVYRETPMGLANLPAIEEPLVGMLATVHALWTLANDAATDASIQTAEGTVIDRATRYQQVMNQISAMTERYQEFCGQLNVGVFRIETLQLRRTSQTTGRLVPVFKPREYDDPRWPQRELPPIDHRNDDNSGIPSPIWSTYGP